jgi:hypothetical protein
MSTRVNLDRAMSKTGATISLVHRLAGWECAGAGTRNVGEAWGSLYEMRDGTRGGQWFKTHAEALAHFEARRA